MTAFIYLSCGVALSCLIAWWAGIPMLLLGAAAILASDSDE